MQQMVKKLKPHVSNLALRIRIYCMDKNAAALQLERKFIRIGITYYYNCIRCDRFGMTAGNKIYKTNLINQGQQFLYAFVSLILEIC